MIVTNRQPLPVDWNSYCQLDAHSFSSLKLIGKTFQPTAKMRLGSLVHQYILQPSEYNYEQIELVKPIATAMLAIPGIQTFLKSAICEQPWTANFNYEGFQITWRGIPDIRIPKLLIIDIKVTELPIEKAVNYFGYNDQQVGYMLGTDTPRAMIISVHPKTHKVGMYNVKNDLTWWQQQCLIHGSLT